MNGHNESESGTARIIGIDLGTTNCCLSAYREGSVSVIELDGGRSMPSCVAFTDEQYLVGRAAAEQMLTNPCNTIVDSKRLIGRSFSDKEVQHDLHALHWPFLVQRNENDRPQYAVQCLGQEMVLFPDMIGQLLLTKMRETAEAYLGGPIDGAVITVPAYFSDAQRQATRTAALQADLTLLPNGVINEPTAAALAYSRQINIDAIRVALVFDFGGGTFDVSLVRLDGSVVEVLGTGGNNHLGGEDITSTIMRYFLNKIKERYDVDLEKPHTFRQRSDQSPAASLQAARRTMMRLRNMCEDMKCRLTEETSVTRLIDELCPQLKQFKAHLDRETFEFLNQKVFDTCMACTDKALKAAKLEADQVDDVILVGGSTRILKVKELLAEKFGEEKIRDHVNPDEVVAYGAGVQAASVYGLSNSTLLDVTPHSLGVAIVGDVMSIIYERNAKVGKSKERSFTTTADGQTKVTFEVYEGEKSKASENTLIDSFSLTGIPNMPAGVPNIIVKFRVDYDGTLSASAIDKTEGGKGNRVSRKALKVLRKKAEQGIREREQMQQQTNLLSKSMHRMNLGMQPVPA